jgi:hypothetical protein
MELPPDYDVAGPFDHQVLATTATVTNRFNKASCTFQVPRGGDFVIDNPFSSRKAIFKQIKGTFKKLVSSIFLECASNCGHLEIVVPKTKVATGTRRRADKDSLVAFAAQLPHGNDTEKAKDNEKADMPAAKRSRVVPKMFAGVGSKAQDEQNDSQEVGDSDANVDKSAGEKKLQQPSSSSTASKKGVRALDCKAKHEEFKILTSEGKPLTIKILESAYKPQRKKA